MTYLCQKPAKTLLSRSSEKKIPGEHAPGPPYDSTLKALATPLTYDIIFNLCYCGLSQNTTNLPKTLYATN